jgi:hypothetical protein
VPLLCPGTDESATTITNGGLYPPLFYFVLSWFVTPWGSDAVVLIRIASVFCVVLVMASLAHLLPTRYQLVLLLVILTTFVPTGYFLFASINPSSWAALGVGFGWLGIHAAVTQEQMTSGRKLVVGGVGATGWLMAAGSRWDAPAFLAVIVVLIAVHALWLRSARIRLRAVAIAALLVSILFLVLETVTPHRPSYYLGRMITYSADEPDNVAFLTHYALQVLPNALRALGSVPVMSGVSIPEIVYLGGIGLIAWFVAHTFNSRQTLQWVGSAIAIGAMAFVIMAQVILVDNRDLFGVEPRYVYPLLPFVGGWWFLLGTDSDQWRSVLVTKLRYPVIIVTVLFGISLFAVAERFVDVQTFGVRPLPEGPDQWWWSWMPVGPNIVVAAATYFFWRFATGFTAYLSRDSGDRLSS